MSVIHQEPQPGLGAEYPSDPESCSESENAGGDATALKGVFRILSVFSVYLLLVDLASDTTSMSNLVEALLRFIPFCGVLVLVVMLARPMVKLNKATLLMVLFLVCVFLVFLLGLTRHLHSLDGVAVIGQSSHFGRNLEGFLMFVAVGCFLTGGYFMIEEVVLGKVRLQQQVQKLQQVEAVLAESEARFRTLVEHAPDGIYVQIQGRFAYLNSTALSHFGATASDQLLNRPIVEQSPPDDRQVIAERIRLLDQERKAIPRSEQTFLRLDGTAFDVAASAVPFVFNNQNAALVFFRDITERKRLEDRLRQAQKMEAVGELAGGVAHDFNNIMTVIEGYCGLLLEEDSWPAKKRAALEQIAQAAHRATSLIQQLLMFSRRKVMRIRPLDMNEALNNLRTMLPRLLGEEIDLQFHERAELPMIEADLGMMEQVVVNLSTNARDAMPKGGNLTISTDLLEVDADAAKINPEARGGRFVCLVVSDTGCGMSETTRKHMFEPFFTTKDVGKGTGLGLSTVYGIVKQHNGWIDAKSVVGEGSTFSIFLPVAVAPAPAPVQTASSPVRELRGGCETVLLVEDEAVVRELVRQCLRSKGYCVLEAANGVEALALWQQQREQIDLLFTDMRMPEGIGGMELAERLMAEKSTLKVIISSGYSLEMFQHGEPTSPAITLLPKPYLLETLAKTVRKSLDEATVGRHD